MECSATHGIGYGVLERHGISVVGVMHRIMFTYTSIRIINKITCDFILIYDLLKEYHECNVCVNKTLDVILTMHLKDPVN